MLKDDGKKRRTARERSSKKTLARRSVQRAELGFLKNLITSLTAGRPPSGGDASWRYLGARLTAWHEAAGEISLDEALGMKPARGQPHPLADHAKEYRRSIYVEALATLHERGFTRKEAIHAVASRFRASPPWQTDTRWYHRFPALRPLSLKAVEALHAPIIIADELANRAGELQMTEREWAAELKLYPAEMIPGRFRSQRPAKLK